MAVQKKIIATIEARMGSTRLPGKVLKPLAGAPMLQRVFERAAGAGSIDRVVLATTTEKRDDVLVHLAEELGTDYYRGSEEDVLDRLAGAIKKYTPDVVVSLTGDNPLIDPVLIDDMVSFFFSKGYDYAASTHMHHSDKWMAERTFPAGISVQVIRAGIILDVSEEIKDIKIREHGTYGIYNRTDGKYKLGDFQAEGKYIEWRHPELRFTVDTPEDYELMSRIYNMLYHRNPAFSSLEAIKLVSENPELKAINAGVQQRIAHERLRAKAGK
ncbi:MAG: glycosyltransferase family protein [Nitrospirae bacterium]|nr:glycosyltransferase family protein [Nitrospirota bacterium]